MPKKVTKTPQKCSECGGNLIPELNGTVRFKVIYNSNTIGTVDSEYDPLSIYTCYWCGKVSSYDLR